MTTKFNLENLPDLKIRVANKAESERAQEALFALGFFWIGGGKTFKNTHEPFLFTESPHIKFGDKKEAEEFKFDPSHEITLPELESLTAGKRLQSHIEKANGNGWQKDGRDADEQLAEIRGNDEQHSYYTETMDEIEERLIEQGGYQ